MYDQSYPREKLMRMLSLEWDQLDLIRDEPEELEEAIMRHRRLVEAMPKVRFASNQEASDTWARMGDLIFYLLNPQARAIARICMPAAACYVRCLKYAPERVDIRAHLDHVRLQGGREAYKKHWAMQLLDLVRKARATGALEEGKAAARRVGCEIYWMGGIEWMQEIAHYVRDLGRQSGQPDALGYIERWWNNIGEWRA